MKSIKPGRGPSAMGAVGSIFSAIFGIIWTIAAASMGAPVFFWLFGVVFVILGIVQAIYNFKNATGENRYSEFDIVDSTEEPDPLAQKLGLERENPESEAGADTPVFRDIPPAGAELRYCPYCGARLGSGFTFCGKCGKRLPEEP